MMMDEWRREWHAGTGGGTDANFPIGFVQIGPLGGTPGPVNASVKTFKIRMGQVTILDHCACQLNSSRLLPLALVSYSFHTLF